MMTPHTVQRDAARAGPINRLCPILSFLDDQTFFTKTGGVGLAYRVRGIDAEGLDSRLRDDAVRLFHSGLTTLPESIRLAQYYEKRLRDPLIANPCAHQAAAAVIRRRVDDVNTRRRPYAYDVTYVLLLDGPAPRITTTRSQAQELQFQGDALNAARDALGRLAGQFETAVGAPLGLVRMDQAETFAFFQRLLNVDPRAPRAPLPDPSTPLDYFVGNSSITLRDDHLRLGGRTAKVLTMKAAPKQTSAHLLNELDRLPGEFIACLWWHYTTLEEMKRDLWWRELYYRGQALSPFAFSGGAKTPGGQAPIASAIAVGEAASSLVQCGAVRTDLEHERRRFGFCSLTLLLHAAEPRAVDDAVAHALQVLARHDGLFFVETDGAAAAWLAMLPGNEAYNVRAPRLKLTDLNLADLSFLFRLDQGEPWNAHLNAPYLCVFETRDGGLYFHNLHVGDVGHQLILGETGGGKSYLSAFQALHALQYGAQMLIFDAGHSYRRFTAAMGGSYLTLGLNPEGVTLNPFSLSPCDETYHFLLGFVRVLLDSTKGEPLTDSDDRKIYAAIKATYRYEPDRRRLFYLTLPPALQSRLNQWTHTGRFPIFDNASDTLEFSDLQAFDFSAMKEFPEVLQPLSLYLIHRLRSRIQRGRLTYVVWDESWLQFSHPVFLDYGRLLLKAGRKDDVVLVLITQGLHDFKAASASLLPDVLQNCHTTCILPGAVLDDHVAQLLGLNDTERQAVATLISKQEFLLKKRGLGSKVLKLITTDSQLYSHDRGLEAVAV